MFHVKQFGSFMVGMSDKSETTLFVDIVNVFLWMVSFWIVSGKDRLFNIEG